MKNHSRLSLLLFLMLTFVSLNSAADGKENGGVNEKPVAADTPEKFAPIAAQIRADMNTGGRYEFITATDRAKVGVDLNAMQGLLQKSGSVAAMTADEKVQLFNYQENLNGLLTHHDSNRLVCQHNAPLGTHIPVTTCHTVGEIERVRRESEKGMQDSLMIGSRCLGAGPPCAAGSHGN
jgi:hypothetical protein